ncbi:MAG: hypothetical protein LBB66_10960 [Desulfovibrio sp.]|jgi:hypothetical protein|nr:hypothetical protein [Desulfovibrio sp.]
MSRKPVHIEAAERGGKAYGRQAMWEAMRKRDLFTLTDIGLASGRNSSSVGNYVKRLLAAGIVAEAGLVNNPYSDNKRYRRMQYRVINDIGHEAPRLKADGTPLIESRDQMWLTMKMLPSFTYAELAADASTEECIVSPVDAQDYCGHLYRAGYLALIREATPTSKAVYKLLPSMNTGPYAPKVQRTKVVFDPNRQEVMWHEEIEP